MIAGDKSHGGLPRVYILGARVTAYFCDPNEEQEQIPVLRIYLLFRFCLVLAINFKSNSILRKLQEYSRR